MAFALLKTLAWLALPSTWVLLALAVGLVLLWLGRARAGRALVTAGRGAPSLDEGAERGAPALDEGAERMTEGLRLANAYP